MKTVAPIHARKEAAPGPTVPPHLRPEASELPESIELLASLESPGLLQEDGGPGEIVVRPDGYHWIAANGRQEFGPFETLEQAQVYRDACDESAPLPAETLQEAESEIGISDWIDPETGQPAEGYCPPHLEE